MPPETTHLQGPTPTLSSSRKRILLLILILVVLVLAGAAWYAYHTYTNNRAALERAKMVKILDAVPENPATKDLTVQDKVRIMNEQHAKAEQAAETAQ